MIRNYYLLTFCLFLCLEGFPQAVWSPVSPNAFPTNASGQIHGISRITQVKFHPTNPNKLYAVSCRGGLFVSSNSGTTWTITPGSDLLPTMRLNSVCIDHTNDQVIYLGTGDANYYYTGSGVYKSTNGGNTYSATTLTGRLVVEILMDPSNANVLIAATDAGIYKSTNAGASWALKSSSSLACRDMVFKAKTGTQTIFASTYSELYRSTNMGETWSSLSNGIYFPSGSSNGGGCRIAVTPADSNLIYFSMIARNGTIFKSTDGGNTFINVKDADMPNLTAYSNSPTSTGQGDYNCMFNADPVNKNTLYFGAHNFWKSLDGGATWSQLTDWWAKLHTDMHWVKVSPYNSNQIWTANDGGVWLSTNGGNDWTPKSDGIYGYEIYHGNCSPTRRDMFSIGTQDNGELYHSSGTWFTNRGGDWGSQCAFDYRPNSSMVYYFSNNERRLVNGGDQTYNLPVSSLQDIAFHRSNANLAFAGNLDVYRTTTLTNSTPTWTKISNINKTIKAIHVNLADMNRLYVITNDAKIYVSNDALSATPTFTMYTLPNSTNSVASMTSIKTSSNILYAVLNTRVYRSADNGATWTNVSGNLPSINWVRILPDEYYSQNELVFVAGNTSVYYKKTGQSNWTLFSTGLPTRTNIIDMSVFDDGTNQSVLRVSEYGRGMWEIPLTTVRSVTSEFAVDQAFPCAGVPVQFSDLSTGNVTTWNWSFPGGTPATSTLQNPTVTYNTNGIYNVTLLVSDGTNNNTLTKTAYINLNGNNLPLLEGFESGTFPPAEWNSLDIGSDAKMWQHSASVGGYALSPSSIWYDNYSVNSSGQFDEVRSPRFDISGLQTATLTFDVAYQPYNTTNYTDTLEILVSTNCGASFTPVYFKGGSILSTVPGTLNQPFIPTSTQWRTETINLSSYISTGTLLISFRNRGYFGNNLYIDNIHFNGTITTNAGPDKVRCMTGSTAIGSTPVTGFSYSWSPATGLSSSTISNPSASPSLNTTYILTATKSGTTISAKDTVVVLVDTVPVSAVIGEISCLGGNDGTINLTNSIGIAPYSYLWSNTATTEDLSGLPAGSYSVIITDGLSCTRSYNYTLTQPSTLLSVSAFAIQSNCNLSNGYATAIASGGNAPYTYNWDNGTTTATTSGLATGNYIVTATDGRNCTASASAEVTMKALPVINSFTSSPSSPCNQPYTLTVISSGSPGPNSYSSGNLKFAITDNYPAGINLTIPVNHNIELTQASQIAVTLNFGTASTVMNREHTWSGQLKATLTSPGGSTVIFDRPGHPATASGSSADLNGSYTFIITALDILPPSTTSPFVVSGNVINGNYRPSDGSNPDVSHNWSGLSFPFNAQGNWTLNIADNINNDSGDLISWSLALTTPYSHSFSGPGSIGVIDCVSSDCGEADAVVTYNVPGNHSYNVVTTSPDGCTTSSSTSVNVGCGLVTLNLKVFLEGFYNSSNTMLAIADPVNYPNLCDTVTIELHNDVLPYNLEYSSTGVIDIYGEGNFNLPEAILNRSFYLSVKHRNSIEIWSKNPVFFNSSVINFDFTRN